MTVIFCGLAYFCWTLLFSDTSALTSAVKTGELLTWLYPIFAVVETILCLIIGGFATALAISDKKYDNLGPPGFWLLITSLCPLGFGYLLYHCALLIATCDKGNGEVDWKNLIGGVMAIVLIAVFRRTMQPKFDTKKE